MKRLGKNWITSLLIVLLSLRLMFSLFSFLYRCDNKYTAGPPYGAAGVFAFSDEDLVRPLFLIDGWELQLDGTDSWQEVFIGQYSNFSYVNNRHSPFGAATYRLMLAFDGAPRPLTLEIPELFTSYTLWIDGVPAAQNGTGRSITFLADGQTELRLNVENYTHYHSGMTYPPALGTPEIINRMFSARDLFYATLILCSLTLAVFSGVLWLTRERGIFLPFGMLCLFFAVSCLHPFIWQWGLSGRLWYVVEGIARLAVLACTCLLCSEIAGFTGKLWYRRGVCPALAGLCLFAGISVYLIIPTFPAFIKPYASLISTSETVLWLYLLLCTVSGLEKNIAGSRFVLAGSVVLGSSLLLNLADDNHFEPIYAGWQTEYAGFFMVLIFGGLMVTHNRNVLQKNRQLILHMEGMVEQRTAELYQVLEERKAFFSDLAHNLKAPIAAVHMFIGSLRESNLYLDPELIEYLDMIESENTEMQKRVQALRTLNAFDRLSEPSTILSVDALLEEVERKNRPETDAAGIYFTVGKLGVPATMKGKREKLLILFENLIFNALAFTPLEGSISILPRIEGGEVVITVSDTGCGIAPEHLPHIFERFYVGRENKSEGSGLGLYIARLTVEELGGSIAVESTQGEGTSFIIRLLLGTNPS